jgi:hypothetical protein
MRAVVTIGMNRYGDDYARKAKSRLPVQSRQVREIRDCRHQQVPKWPQVRLCIHRIAQVVWPSRRYRQKNYAEQDCDDGY